MILIKLLSQKIFSEKLIIKIQVIREGNEAIGITIR